MSHPKKFDVDIGVRYAGYCYDGPHEGQWHESETPMMMKYSQGPLWRTALSHGGLRDLEIHVHQIFYRWSDPLKAWVCLNMK